MKKLEFYWHPRDDVLVGSLMESLSARIEHIKKYEDFFGKRETKIKLRLLKPVKGELPLPVIESAKILLTAKRAREASKVYYDSVYEDGTIGQIDGDACRNYAIAFNNYEKTLIAHREEIMALHIVECPNCPRTWEAALESRVDIYDLFTHV